MEVDYTVGWMTASGAPVSAEGFTIGLHGRGEKPRHPGGPVPKRGARQQKANRASGLRGERERHSFFGRAMTTTTMTIVHDPPRPTRRHIAMRAPVGPIASEVENWRER